MTDSAPGSTDQMQDEPASNDDPKPDLGPGTVLASMSDAIVRLHAQYYGRGATKARSFWVHDNLVLCELRDVYLTIERNLIKWGHEDTVRATRQTFQQAMYDVFVGTVEELTGRKVEGFISVSHMEPDVIYEMFLLEPVADRSPRLAREAREDAGDLERPEPGIQEPDQDGDGRVA
jgi:uncharacterized protein YbcI